jgi:hypothetical protein
VDVGGEVGPLSYIAVACPFLAHMSVLDARNSLTWAGPVGRGEAALLHKNHSTSLQQVFSQSAHGQEVRLTVRAGLCSTSLLITLCAFDNFFFSITQY